MEGVLLSNGIVHQGLAKKNNNYCRFFKIKIKVVDKNSSSDFNIQAATEKQKQ